MRNFTSFFVLLLAGLPLVGMSQEKDLFKSGTFSALKFRSIGPALTSGRVADLAVNPEDHREYYVAAASGGVWKTVNAGNTFQPIFDGQGSYSIGCLALDPSNPHVVWVGTGENNGQRSVGYGDGVYRSQDGGKSWKHMGLKSSEHIGKIVVDPSNSNTVYVAAQGPLWSAGGDRGLYKTTDGGKTWNRILHISEHTGVSDLVMDPRDPNVLYAAAYQRRRHVYTYISGGPESALFKSTDGGVTWDTLRNGLPSVDLGRIGLAIAPSDPDYVYAIVETAGKEGGFFRSTDRGASWQKRNGYYTSGNYYQEIVCDPLDRDRVFALDTWGHVTTDGGKTFQKIGEKNKHVDNHAIWVDPTNTDHWLMGCDGGLYETFDNAQNWDYKPNLPITQFYKVAVDQSAPFYNIYGGTQDNFSLGGPARTNSGNGIVNADWFITHGGDGFESQVDPTNPDIVYAQSQYGFLVRYDRKSGEEISIRPMPAEGEPALRWNWDAPLLISPHSATRLYFAANRLFRSDDRGDSWTAISEDLSRQLDRNTLPVMGRVWGVDAVAKNQSTTIYGNIVALTESPKQEDLLYAGTDDGLVHVTEDAGQTWRKLSIFPGVPEKTYVNMLTASRHDARTVYAAFNNHKNGDFKPYLLKSTDAGQTWQSISGNLPKRGSVYAIVEDHVQPNLLFAGTEFGLFFSVNGGEKWVRLKNGLPTVAVRDIAIQERENDLVLATFGRGFYVLDNYAPLREVTAEVLASEAHVFPVKDPLVFIEAYPLGLPGKSFQGAGYFSTPNPKIGAVITSYLKETIKTQKAQRKEAEKALVKEKKAVPYPTFEQMRAEDNEEDPYLLFTITDGSGAVVRRLKAPAKAGMHRLTWDLRYAPETPTRLKPVDTSNPFASAPIGNLVLPGTYSVSMAKVINGRAEALPGNQSFEVKLWNNATLAATDRAAVQGFVEKVRRLRRAASGAGRYQGELQNRIRHLKVATQTTPGGPITWMAGLKDLEDRLQVTSRQLNGDRSVAQRQFETLPGINGRIGSIAYNLWQSTAAPTKTQQDSYRIAAKAFTGVLAELKAVGAALEAIEQEMETAGAPWTPGRLPVWEEE